MIVTHDTPLIDQLAEIAVGDIGLVQDAIRASANESGRADLRDVVGYIVERRSRQTAPNTHNPLPDNL